MEQQCNKRSLYPIIMKKYLCFISIYATMIIGRVLAGDTETIEWGAVTNNFQMSISLKCGGHEIKTNEPVVLLIKYRNVSTNETIIVFNHIVPAMDATYSFVVISPSGKDISPNIPKSLTGSGGNYPISPNQTREFDVDLSQFCKFDELGAYKIISKKVIFADPKNKWFTVVSNPLSIIASN
jgi:hypothetical protein